MFMIESVMSNDLCRWCVVRSFFELCVIEKVGLGLGLGFLEICWVELGCIVCRT